MKQQIYQARALMLGGGKGIQVESDGEHAVRLEVLPGPGTLVDDNDARIRYTGDWVRVDAGPKCLGGTETMSNHGGDALTFTFHGSGIAWIGPRDLILGKADVSIDGKLEAAGIDGYNPWVIGTARGEEKEYRQILFSKEGLSAGEHTLRIVVCGEKNPRAGGAYVAVDALRVTGEGAPGMVRLHILNEWNYPELTWGNYVKPGVKAAEGDRNSVRLRLVGE
jgi:hypothetical protein